jgi:glycosyltransferase involved in cell wall biosynthesis
MASAARQSRIAILTSSDCNLSGMERNAVNVTRAFARQGYQTRCLFPQTPNTERLLEWCQQQGVAAEQSTDFLHYNSVHTLATTRRLRNLFADWRPAAVSLHYPAKLPVKDMLAARWAGVRRCVATIHCMPESLSSRQRLMTRLASRLVDGVIVHARAVGEALIAGGVPAKKVIYIPLGIHRPEVQPTQAEARQRLGLPDHAFVVGTLARLVPEKGIVNVIEAVGHLPTGADGPYLLLAGEGPQREALAAQAQAALGERARLLGQVDAELMASFYAALDVFALTPYIREAFGMVYIEAAQFGVPSVSWRVGGIAEAVLDGETGLLVEANDLAGVEQHLAHLRADPALRARLGEQAQERALTEFTEARMAEGYARVLGLKYSVPVPQGEPVSAAL